MDNFKGDFLNISFIIFFHPQIPDFQILYLRQILSDHNKPYINGKLISKCIHFETLMTCFVFQGHIGIRFALNNLG